MDGVIKANQSNTRLIISKRGLIIKHGNGNNNQQEQTQCSKEAEEDQRRVDQQPQQLCSSSKEAEEDQRRNSELVNFMSVSKQKQNLLISNSPKSISSNSDSSSLTTCSLCGRLFPSKQSLFGHMKSHPEREWRGIQPPPPLQSQSNKFLIKRSPSTLHPSPLQSQSNKFLIKRSPSTGSDDSGKSSESYQGVGPLPVNWSVTGKRGRKPYDMLLSDEGILDVVDGLLMLKEGNSLNVLASMSKQIINRETEGTPTLKRKKEMILESSSEEVWTTSDLSRSSEKLKIDQERSCSSSRDGFVPKPINNIQSSQLEQLPSNMFQEDHCSLVMKNSKKLKLDESSSSPRNLKLIKNIHSSYLEQIHSNGFHGDQFSLVKKSSKKVKLDERSCSSRDMFDPKLINSSYSIPSSHVEQMPRNGYFQGDFSSMNGYFQVDFSSMNGYFQGDFSSMNGYFQGDFSNMFSKPEALMKAAANKKAIKVREQIERGGSGDQDMGLQGSCSTNEFKCQTCNRTFPSHQALGGHKSSQRNCKSSNSTSSGSYHHSTHDHQSPPQLMIQTANHDQFPEHISETKKTTTATSFGTHQCELCGETFTSGQALGGHKRKHYTGLNPFSTMVPVNSTTMALTEKLIKKETMTSLLSAVASSVGEVNISTTKPEKKPFIIDLNELPDDQED